MFVKNSEGKAIQSEPEIDSSSLDGALVLAREVVVLRDRLNSVQREYNDLLGQREAAAREGLDLNQQIRPLFLEKEELPAKIVQLVQRIHWLVDQGVAKLNAESSHIAARQYMKSRDNLRQAAEQFREALASTLRKVEAGTNLGPILTDPHNSKLAEIVKILGGVHFPRVSYRLLQLPPLSAELVKRDQLLAAFDNWIAGLR